MREDKPSSTAYVIARSTLFLSHDPLMGRLVPRRSAEMSAWFVQAHSRWFHWVLGTVNRRWVRPFVALLERLSIPGIQLHYALRKRYLEDVARAALAVGVRQVVIIGGGFDTLALRLHEEFPDAQFIEIDHPATQQIKRNAIKEHDLPRENMCLLPLDLTRQTLEEALMRCADYKQHEDSLFICEGVLMYLRPEEVDRLMRFIRGHSNPRSRFAFTFMEPHPDGKVRFRNSSRVVDGWLRLRGEDFQWGIPREGIARYLTDRGLAVEELATSDTLRSRYLVDAPLKHLALAEGEYVCVAAPVWGACRP